MQSTEEFLQEIRQRNKKVELDKKWEGSWTRKLSIMLITYFCACIFMTIIKAEPVFLNAGVPVLGYFLSTLTLPPLKSWWIKKQK